MSFQIVYSLRHVSIVESGYCLEFDAYSLSDKEVYSSSAYLFVVVIDRHIDLSHKRNPEFL